MDETKALLTLEDGTVFHGHTKSSFQSVCAEVIFNTSLTGYQEVCTDPSYAGQIVVFTTSHIGNVGVTAEDCESERLSVAGIVVRSMSKGSSSWRSEQSLISFLEAHRVPWIEGVDTRRLTRHIRTKGPQKGCLSGGGFSQGVGVPLPSIESTPMRVLPRQGAPLIPFLSTSMKSVGEGMGIGRTFIESFNKAHSGLELYPHRAEQYDPWFLEQINALAREEQVIAAHALETVDVETLYRWKQMGFSDERLAALLHFKKRKWCRNGRRRSYILCIKESIYGVILLLGKKCWCSAVVRTKLGKGSNSITAACMQYRL